MACTFWLSNAFADSVKVTVLSELDRFEPFEGHLFHAGNLWVGRSRKDLGSFYRLEVFDANGQILTSQELTHSIRYISPFNDESVLIVGVALNPNQSFYTVAQFKNAKLKLKTVMIPESAMADRGVAKSGNLYFTDPGGLDEGGPLSAPLKTLFHFGSGPRYLKAKIHGPGQIVTVGNALYVIERPNVFEGGKNLIRVDLASEVPQTLFAQIRDNLNNLIVARDQLLAMPERGKDQVLLFDAAKNKLAGAIKVAAGTPRGLAVLGKCLLVGSELAKQVSFYNIAQTGNPLVGQWDLATAGNKFLGLRALAVDAKTGRVFARSAYPCPLQGYCASERNSVIMVTQDSNETFEKCTK